MSLARMSGAPSTFKAKFVVLTFLVKPAAAGRTRLAELDAQTNRYSKFGHMLHVRPNTRALLQHVALTLDERFRHGLDVHIMSLKR